MVELDVTARFNSELTARLRRHVARELYDESPDLAVGSAIYTLSDPRDIRAIRYVGQTSHPRRRFLQHLTAARLWLPDERPWWVASPKLRPLYEWIRALHGDGGRLPTMVVWSWRPTLATARAAERARIYECLAKSLPILNVEAQVLERPPRR
ncbi:MAG TPA: hypothetical protein VHV81_13090 [Steroidobacteraceae bacterium]|jgi:hypothetical protein|nr:hypothetical protein [Steroidobacteraceae bacterium]